MGQVTEDAAVDFDVDIFVGQISVDTTHVANISNILLLSRYSYFSLLPALDAFVTHTWCTSEASG